MNTYVGSFSYSGNVDIKQIQDKHLVIESGESEETTIFVFGKTKIETSEQLVLTYSQIGKLEAYDISISTEDNMVMLNNEIDKDGLYEVVSFESPEVDMRNIIERFQDSFEVICVREAEESEKFGNRIIKADFIY